VLASLSAGLIGWTLLASGGGKASDWGVFRRALEQGGVVPRWAAVPLAAAVAVAEIAAGGWVLLRPVPRALQLAGLLYVLFAMYQAELVRRGQPNDCHCYGRLRRVPPGPGVALANALLSFLAFGASFGAWGVGTLLGRLLWGAAAAAVYLLLAGRAQPRTGLRGYPYAELRYVERRLAGAGDREAREALARDLGVRAPVTYLMIPRHKAWWLVLRARWRGSAASF
jgi:hypothetical protein